MTAQDKTPLNEKVAHVAEVVKEKVEEMTERARKELHEADFDNVREPVIRVVEDARAKVDSLKAEVKQVAEDVQDSPAWKTMEQDRGKWTVILLALLGIFAVLMLRRRSH